MQRQDDAAAPAQRPDAGPGVTPAQRSFPVVVLDFLQQHPGLVVTFGYLLLTAIGITYDVLYYRHFGIAILSFSEPGDFLLAGFRQPVLFVLFVAAVAVLLRLIVKDRRLRQQSERYRALAEKMERSRWYSNWVMYPLIICLYFGLTTDVYAKYMADRLRSGDGAAVVIERNASTGGKPGGVLRPQLLVGTNSTFLFLYSPETGAIEVVPIGSVSRMRIGVASPALPAPAEARGKRP